MQPRFKPSGLPTEKVIEQNNDPNISPPLSPDYTTKQMRIAPNDVDFETIARSVKQVESGGGKYNYNPKSGAIGPMQTMPATLVNPGYGVRPARNNSMKEMERVGRDYLNAMINHYVDLNYGLAAYNWGPGNVNRWIKRGADPSRLPKETREYIPKVHNAYRTFGGSFAQAFQQNSGLEDQVAENNTPVIEKEIKPLVKEDVSIIPRGMAGFHYNEKQILPTTITKYPKEQSSTAFAEPKHKFIPKIKAYALGAGATPTQRAGGVTDEMIEEVKNEAFEKFMEEETRSPEEKEKIEKEKEAKENEMRKQQKGQNLLDVAKLIVPIVLGVVGTKLISKGYKAIKKGSAKGKTGAAALLDMGLYPVRRNVLNTITNNLNESSEGRYSVSGSAIVDEDGKVFITAEDIDQMIYNQDIFNNPKEQKSL